MPLSLVYMPQVAGSTQEEARRLPLTGDDSRIRVIYTFFQQAGIGQAGKKWFGDRNKNIAATFVLEPCFLPADYLFLINMTLSLGVLDYVQKKHADFSLKWPNDIYWHEKKTGGLLLSSQVGENNLLRSLYFGVGLNINQDVFPLTIPNPVSLRQIDGKTRDLPQEVRVLAECVQKRYTALRQAWRTQDPEEVFARWKSVYLAALLYVRQWRAFEWKGQGLEARIENVDQYGRLVLETRSGAHIVADIKEVGYRFGE